MRAYFFTNHYLSSLQHGIQTQHCISDMFVKYAKLPPAQYSEMWNRLMSWADVHKTSIVLNGGNNTELTDLSEKIHHLAYALRLPCAEFHEDGDSLGGLLTCVGIIIPLNIYVLSSAMRNGRSEEDMHTIEDSAAPLSQKTYELAELLTKYELAR